MIVVFEKNLQYLYILVDVDEDFDKDCQNPHLAQISLHPEHCNLCLFFTWRLI